MTEEERPAGVRRVSVADADLPPAAPKEPALPFTSQQLGTIFAWTIAIVALIVLIWLI
jgi:hypothetical protein